MAISELIKCFFNVWAPPIAAGRTIVQAVKLSGRWLQTRNSGMRDKTNWHLSREPNNTSFRQYLALWENSTDHKNCNPQLIVILILKILCAFSGFKVRFFAPFKFFWHFLSFRYMRCLFLINRLNQHYLHQMRIKYYFEKVVTGRKTWQ